MPSGVDEFNELRWRMNTDNMTEDDPIEYL